MVIECANKVIIVKKKASEVCRNTSSAVPAMYPSAKLKTRPTSEMTVAVIRAADIGHSSYQSPRRGCR